MTISILNAKGQKDRILPLSDKLLALLKKYYIVYKPKLYLIEENIKGSQYSETSLREIFKKDINQVVPGNTFTLHCLRHSFATHLFRTGDRYTIHSGITRT